MSTRHHILRPKPKGKKSSGHTHNILLQLKIPYKLLAFMSMSSLMHPRTEQNTPDTIKQDIPAEMGMTKNMTSVCVPSSSMYTSYTGLKKVGANHFWKVGIEKHSLLWTKL